MSFWIDPHIHMISRVTDDYHRMAMAGCVALSEPAFRAGFDRGTAECCGTRVAGVLVEERAALGAPAPAAEQRVSFTRLGSLAAAR